MIFFWQSAIMCLKGRSQKQRRLFFILLDLAPSFDNIYITFFKMNIEFYKF